MAILTMPSAPAFNKASFGLITNAVVHTSPLTGVEQTLELAGSKWAGTFELPPIRYDNPNSAIWEAFLSELMGVTGRFNGFDPRRRSPRGSNLGTPIVNGADQTGKSLSTSGWDVSETGLLLPGDYFQVGTFMGKVVASVDSDGAGIATINFVPLLRGSPANGASIITVNPVAVMKLTSNDGSFWNEEILTYGFAFSMIEALD